MMGNLNQKPQEQIFTCKICIEPLKLRVNNKFNRCLHPFCNNCTIRYLVVKLNDIKYPGNKPFEPKIRQQMDKWLDELFESVVLKGVESPLLIKGDNLYKSPNGISHEVVISDGNGLMRCPRCSLHVIFFDDYSIYCYRCYIRVCYNCGRKREAFHSCNHPILPKIFTIVYWFLLLSLPFAIWNLKKGIEQFMNQN